MAEPQILDPGVAGQVFLAATAAFREGVHEIPGSPPVEWFVRSSTFPELKIHVAISGTVRIVLVVDCTNYDYDPPTVHFEDLSGRPLSWGAVRQLVALYSGIVRGQPHDDINDVLLFQNGVGLICRKGQAGFHEVHPEVNWRELRTANEGRLESIIDASIRLLDPRKLAALP